MFESESTESTKPEAKPAPAPTVRRRRWPWVLAALLGVLLAGFAGLTWLAATESGLIAACRLAVYLGGGRLELEAPSGRLIGPLQVRQAIWRDAGLTVRIEDAALDWAPAALRSGRLEVARLAIDTLAIELPPAKKEPPVLPPSLRVPLAVDIGEIALGRIEVNGKPVAENLGASLHSDGLTHRLSGLHGRAGLVEVTGEASLAGDPPYALTAQAAVSGQWQSHAFSLAAQADGTLARPSISGTGKGAVQGRFAAVLTPFAAQPFERLEVHLAGIDPAAWAKGAPAASLDLDADLQPRVGAELTVGGNFVVLNRQPGRIDAQQLPLTRLSGRAEWARGAAVFSDLAASLAGGARLTGKGGLAQRTLTLDLDASGLDAAAFHPRLRPTRLSGPLKLKIGDEEQTLAADLADPAFRLGVQLAHRDRTLEIGRLALAAGEASLQAKGRLSLDAAYRFEASGALARFNPGRFAKLPPASLNANFKAAGSLAPRPVLAFEFKLLDSNFNGHPLAGEGQADLDWPQLRRANLRLEGGPNRLEARGAFGRPGDSLEIHIAAPELAPYGVEGGIEGDLRLGGTPAVPTLNGAVQAERLGVPGLARLKGLRLSAEAGTQADDPLRFDLRIAALDTAKQPAVARDFSLKLEGSRAHHRLQAAGVLAGENHLALAAAGGLAAKEGAMLWSGELQDFALTPPDEKQRLALQQPAPIRLGAGEWAVGPAELTWLRWRGNLQASAANGHLQLAVKGVGERLGEIELGLEAGLTGAWALAQDAAWQGHMDLKGADLAALGPLLGEDWQTAGRVRGALRLAGTPARPLVTGQVDGEHLGLVIPSLNSQLENGRLALTLAGNRLRLENFSFDSKLHAPPQALIQAAGKEIAALADKPGKIEMHGELGFGEIEKLGSGQESGWVELRLERLGVIQLPDQWVAVSGDGRLRWQDGALGAVAKLNVDAGWWELARLGVPKLSDDVVVRRARQEKPAATFPRPEIDVTADFGPHFHFQGVGLETRLAGSVRLRSKERDLLRASGSIRTLGGRFDAYGQKLVIERGILNFQDFIDNPALNVRAVRRGLAVEPGVEVTGTVKKPVVRLVSDPELPEAEKLSWLVLGHGPEQTGSGDASVLLAAAGDILGGESGGLRENLREHFGIEEFGLRQGSVGDTGGRQMTSRVASAGGFSGDAATGEQIVTVGKRLSSSVLLSYEQALGRAENVVKLTVNLSRRFSVVGRAGSDNAVDFLYTLNFGR